MFTSLPARIFYSSRPACPFATLIYRRKFVEFDSSYSKQKGLFDFFPATRKWEEKNHGIQYIYAIVPSTRFSRKDSELPGRKTLMGL